MTAKKIVDVLGITIYTDFDLIEDTVKATAFLRMIEKIEGVEKITAARYHIEVSVALLFHTKDVCDEVVSTFEEFYGLVVSDVDTELLLDKMTQAGAGGVRNMMHLFGDDESYPEA